MSYSHATNSTTGENEFGQSGAEMLSRNNGQGQCTAWADLLVVTMGSQGIAATSKRIDPNAGYIGFRVKLVPAQGSVGDYPVNEFGFHQVVRVEAYPDRIYDPSYGGSPTEKTDWRPVEVKYEDENITHLYNGLWVTNPESNILYADNQERRNVTFSP